MTEQQQRPLPVLIPYSEWQGFDGEDEIVQHDPDQIIFRRDGIVYVVGDKLPDGWPSPA